MFPSDGTRCQCPSSTRERKSWPNNVGRFRSSYQCRHGYADGCGIRVEFKSHVHYGRQHGRCYGEHHIMGNITVSAEFNFHSDPEAAFIVLSNVRCPTYIAPWELCLLKTSLEWVNKLHAYLGKFSILKIFNRIGV